MTLSDIITVNIVDSRQSELEHQENQIVGKLYRDLISFEYQQDNDKTWHQIDYVINNARRDCQNIGSDGKFLEAFIKRLNISTTSKSIPYDR